MNSASNFTLRVPHDPLNDHVSAFRTALELFGSAEPADFLPPREHPKYLEILSEMVRLALAHSWKVNKPIPLEGFQASYPELFANPVLTYPIAKEEFLQRQKAGEQPTMTEYRQRFQLGPRDGESASKFDVALSGQGNDDYPATLRPEPSDPPSSWPNAEIGQTRLGLPAERGAPLLSDPEIVWKQSEAMREMPSVGEEFLGFSLLAELGKGAFGKVFLAQQGQLAGRLVAVKVAAGLFTESQTLAQLQHSHIVPIYSYHHSQPFQAVCMPYLGSTTLAHVLADIRTHKSMPSSGRDLLITLHGRRKSTHPDDDSSLQTGMHQNSEPLPGKQAERSSKPHRTAPSLELEGLSYVDSVLWLAVRLADGLAHAHERGILHRDLKPANILLTDDGLPMLLDFNLAQDTKVRGSATAASIGGTLPYMAPEHLEAFRGNPLHVDARSDLYSLGIILFELLTGAAPFPSYRKLPVRETVDRMIQDRQQGAPRLRPLNQAISPAVQAIVRRCLETDPARRYQSVRELQEDLQRQLEHKPLKHTANPSLWERCQKYRRRHPRLTSSTTIAIAALAIIAGMAVTLAAREEQRAHLEARATLARFDDDAQTTYFLLNARTAKDQLGEGERSARTALEHFHVLEDPDWRDSPAVKRLPIDEQARLEEEIGQLLVLLAHAQQLAGERANDPPARAEKFNAGLQFCSLAGSCFPEESAPQALWKQRAELHKRLNQREEADQCLERAKKVDLMSAQDRYLTARLLAEEGKFRAALPLVREALQQKPQDFNLHFLQGICHDYLGQNADATACYRACIALRPKFHGAYYNRGLAYLRQNDHRSARADFDQVIRLRPEFDEAYVHRALASQGLAKHRDAIADLTEALDRGFAQTRVYFLRSKVRQQARDWEGAKKDLDEGMRQEPTDELSWIARGLAHLPREPKKALHDFDQALKLEPRSLAGLQNKAHVLAKYFKHTEEAIQTLDKAIECYPDDARPRAGRGVYLARLGKRSAALKDAEQALLLDTSPDNLYQVAGIYALTSKTEPDDRQEALRLLTLALKKGFGFEYLEIDRDLDPIRDLPAFRRVIEASRALRAAAPEKSL